MYRAQSGIGIAYNFTSRLVWCWIGGKQFYISYGIRKQLSCERRYRTTLMSFARHLNPTRGDISILSCWRPIFQTIESLKSEIAKLTNQRDYLNNQLAEAEELRENIEKHMVEVSFSPLHTIPINQLCDFLIEISAEIECNRKASRIDGICFDEGEVGDGVAE